MIQPRLSAGKTDETGDEEATTGIEPVYRVLQTRA